MESRFGLLFNASRRRGTTVPGRDLATEFLSDKSRIVTCSAFRRLQTKAQVFSLEQNASVRTRLTHTLEAAMYGELIAGKALTLLGDVDENLHVPFITTTENACLLHDLGNPPFGHLGEFAIQDWFRHQETEIKETWKNLGVPADQIDPHYRAFKFFDGNPQGLRIVTRLQWLQDEFGLNLTCALLAATLKYLAAEIREGDAFRKKIGFFETEREVVSGVWASLDMPTSPDGTPSSRHPIAFLMEAADDIAYCLSDIEDAIEKRILTEDDFFHDERLSAINEVLRISLMATTCFSEVDQSFH